MAVRLQAVRTVWLWRAVVVVAALALAASAVQAEPLQATKLSEHVHYFQGAVGQASAANQGFMSNAGFVVTSEGVVVFDTLGTPALGQGMIDAIRRITDQPIRRVILSHYHADHFYGAQSFKAIGAEIWAHAAGRASLTADLAQQRLAQRRADLFPWVDENTRLVPADRWLAFDPDGELRFELGGVRFRLLDVGGAHSPEDLMMFVENDAVLFAGDLYFTGRVPFVGGANTRAWLRALGRLTALSPAMAVPGHGAASRHVADDLRLTRDYLTYLRDQMARAVEELTPFDEAYRAVDWSRYAKVPAFGPANRLNASSVYLEMERESLQKP